MFSIAKFYPLFFISGLILVVGSVGSAWHYQAKAKSTALLLQQAQAAQREQQAVLERYEQRQAELTNKLERADKQAAARRQQLKEALQREEVNFWRNSRVPDDVASVLNQRAAP